jgi:hypothetical protein
MADPLIPLTEVRHIVDPRDPPQIFMTSLRRAAVSLGVLTTDAEGRRAIPRSAALAMAKRYRRTGFLTESRRSTLPFSDAPSAA